MLPVVRFSLILWGLGWLLRYSAWRHASFRMRLKERNLVAQWKARDEEVGRWFEIRNGEIFSVTACIRSRT